jgi:LysR family transcriptional regulator, glycine cleavage system transcriptional activator
VHLAGDSALAGKLVRRIADPEVRLPSLDLLRGFVAVARRMSITQAADDLCVTQSAVSKQVRALEEGLGVKLLERGYRNVSLTDAGRLLFATADAAVGRIVDTVASIVAHGSKPVTLTADVAVVGLWLLPRLAALRERYPNINMRIDSNNSPIDVSRESADLAIRYCSERETPSGARALFCETIQPVKSPALSLKDIDEESLAATVLLEYESRHPWLRWNGWLESKGLRLSAAKAVLRFTQYDQLIQAAASGHGIAMGRLRLLSTWISGGRLECIGAVRKTPPGSHRYWLIPGGSQSQKSTR